MATTTVHRVGTALATSGLVIAAVVLAGWSAPVRVLVQVVPGAPMMTPLTAVLLMLLGTAVLLRARPVTRRVAQRCGVGLGLLVSAGAVVVLFGYLSSLPIGIDRLLFVTQTQEVRGTGRSSPHTAIALLCFGLTVALLDVRPPRFRPATPLFVAGVTVSLTGLLGYAYGVAYLHSLDRVTGMAVHTALCLLLLAGGISAARPDRGVAQMLTSHGPGRVLARRLGPVMLLVPFLAGVLSSGTNRIAGAVPQFLITLVIIGCVLVLMAAVGHVTTTVDAADRRLRDQQAFTNTLLHSLHSGVVVLDPQARVIDVNPRWCELAGRPADAMLGARPPFPWWPGDRATDLGRHLAGTMRGDVPVRTEQCLARPDGSTVTVLATIAPARNADGTTLAWVCTHTDITELKRVEAALRTHTDELERANHELADSNQLKTDLMAMLTHEIAQPLSSIVGSAELLADTSSPEADTPALARRIGAAGHRLTRMVSDMLLMFRLETHAATARPQPVDVGELVTTLVADLAPADDLRHEFDVGLHAYADPDHLRQILTNLVTNARKYGQPPVVIRAQRIGNHVRFTVRDHGSGVPDEFVPHLFSRFTRSETMAAAPGIGLGLYITQQLAQANGATIVYRHATPHGAEFVLDIPAAQIPAFSREAGGRSGVMSPG
ncbi:sensor histidine kinase [Mangrovihabitans endophyticus]|uniref:histidine kinase n=1 Tax=Mangrovihabitans endophyticus TaxID=1751298 RepID=A0A8J3C3Z6_9ACTN|nr:PAS domain-containing sensor histidine kinase [Mangrovihabitans endophyticus]GGL04834.1 hypothetical protein GCM10012284_44250 [Mangrovihabitans endophyticus]